MIRLSDAQKFVLLSGGGWLLDFTLFTLQVSLFRAPESVANFISATIAAMTVFFFAKTAIFRVVQKKTQSSVAYFFYIEVTIIFWSLIIDGLAFWLHQMWPFTDHVAMAALVSKIIVTPFSLVVNFVVARWLLRRNET